MAAASSSTKVVAQRVPSDDPEIQQEEQPRVGASRSVARCRTVAKAFAATLGIAVAIAGAGLMTGHMAQRIAANRAAGVQEAIGESEKQQTNGDEVHFDSQKCHWIKMPQHDFPDRGDTGSANWTNATNVSDLEQLAEKHGDTGFAVKEEDGSVWFKGGPEGPQTWRNLLWMGDQYKVDFYFCEKKSDWRETEDRARKALKVIDTYAKENTASVADQWMSVHALPRAEGAGMGLEREHNVETVEDMKILCGANPDCVGFAYNPKTKIFLSKKKYTGFVADDARYYQKGSQKQGFEGWEWYYIKSRGQKEEAPTSAESPWPYFDSSDSTMQVKQ